MEDTRYEITNAGEPLFDILALTTVLGDKIDLSPLLVTLNIYEDIFSPVLTGNITIYDTLNMFNQLPISGNEKLTIKVNSYNFEPEDQINYLHRTFDIVKVTDINQINNYSKTYTLHFISPEYKQNESIKISKGYQNTTISNIITRLMTDGEHEGFNFPQTDYTGIARNFKSPYLYSNSIERWYKKEDEDDTIDLFIEKTKYIERSISFPYMKPFDIINWLSSRAIRHANGKSLTVSNNESSNFLFYENRRGYNFVSLDTLLESKEYPISKFKYGDSVQNIASDDNKRKINLNTINNLQIENCYDILHNIRHGLYASTFMSYDISSGEYKETRYNYLKEFDSLETTENTQNQKNYPLIKHDENYLTENHLAKRIFAIHSPSGTIDPITSTQTQRFNRSKQFSGLTEYVQSRLVHLLKISDFKINFEIQANSKHKVGDIINIDLKDWISKKSMGNKDFVEESNKYYSGNYLITSIRHNITKDEYRMSIEASKDSLKTKIGK